jgi:exodeoxyribonuclease VII large subunit
MPEGEIGGAQRTLFERPILSVSELTLRIKSALESHVGHVWVSGQISGFKRHQESGHLYFSLKDESAVLRCVMFRFQNRGLRFEPEEGLEVVAFGRVSVYERSGQYQLYVESMQPKGMGILQLRFEQLKKRLAEEGLFDEARKRPLPFLPRAIGIVTSKEGAALQDMVKTIHKRFPAAIHVMDVRVQGDEAAGEIARAIRELPRAVPEVEVIIAGRGGGSIEDLWAFNEEAVVRAIAASRVPVVSAVGHETDFTLADFAADVRAKTPTDAATLVVPILDDLLADLRARGDKLEALLRERINRGWMTLDRFRDSYGLRAVETAGATLRDRLALLGGRAERALGHTVRARRESLAALSDRRLFRDPVQLLEPFRRRLERAESSAALSLPEAEIQVERVRLGELSKRMASQVGGALERLRRDARAVEEKLSALDPNKVLERGYSITMHKGKVVKDASKVPAGSEIESRLHKGSLQSIVREWDK